MVVCVVGRKVSSSDSVRNFHVKIIEMNSKELSTPQKNKHLPFYLKLYNYSVNAFGCISLPQKDLLQIVYESI